MHKFVVANYKMNGSEDFFAFVNKKLNKERTKDTKIVLCPPFVYLHDFKKNNAKLTKNNIYLGAQDLASEDNKKSTGQISAKMIDEMGCKYVIVGHSERRAIYETDEIVAKKAIEAIRHGLVPIVCVGEETKDAGIAQVKAQVKAVFKALKNAEMNEKDLIIFAYEPVWAIGTGEVPNVKQINKAKQAILSVLDFEPPVLYGGSVNGQNYTELLGEMDGFLLGGVSLKVDEFLSIVRGLE